MMSFRRALVLLVAAPLTACGSNAGETALPPAAQAGSIVYRDSGCASCHGTNGQGGVGPRLAGLWGSEVELEDGTTVLADEGYVRESIRDPNAKRVAGYAIPMPENDLDDAEIDSILAFIEAIGPTGSDG